MEAIVIAKTLLLPFGNHAHDQDKNKSHIGLADFERIGFYDVKLFRLRTKFLLIIRSRILLFLKFGTFF